MNPQPPEPQSEALTKLRYTHHVVALGAPCRIRTRGLRLRRPLLYPAELRARILLSERETGFEPATYGLEGHRSSQLSYFRTFSLLTLVGAKGFEPSTPCSQSRCANQTALRPAILSFTVGNYTAGVFFVKHLNHRRALLLKTIQRKEKLFPPRPIFFLRPGYLFGREHCLNRFLPKFQRCCPDKYLR